MRMKDMRIEEEKPDDEQTPVSSGSRYPYGLCLCLTEKELEKLNLSDEVEAGDYLHCVIMAKVTSVSHHHHDSEHGSEKGCRVEMQIVAMSVEDENEEYDDEKDEAEY